MRLLDTDICIEILRGRADVVEKRAGITDRVFTTWITACELLYGAAKSKAPKQSRTAVLAFLQATPALGFDARAAFNFGALKAALEKRGTKLADADLFIASIALSREATLVTGNTRHYDRIDGLPLENWNR